MIRYRRRALPTAGFLFLVLATPVSAAGSLRAGIHEAEITPEKLPIRVSGMFLSRTATKLDGRLFARTLVLASGKERISLTVVDSLMIPRELIDRAKQAASGRCGIPVDRMMVSATHNHSSPPVMGALGTAVDPEYAAFVERRIADSIVGAAAAMIPAAIGWGAIDVPGHTFTRRFILRPDSMRRDPFGDLTVRANMHPGYENPEAIAPSGPSDPQLSILAVQARDGRPLAMLANYSMHYLGVPGDTVSPDYYGIFTERVREGLGAAPGAFLGIMSQGTSGDQMWMDYSRPRKDVRIDDYAAAIAARAIEVYRGIRFVDSVPLAMAETRLRLRRRVPDERRLQWARQTLANAPGGDPRNQVEVYAKEQLLIHDEPERDVPLQAIRIGDLGVATFPNEVYAITGLKIKLQSPLRHTFNVELANGAEGYIPPPEQHKLGGYTTWPARTAGLEVQAEPKIVEALLGLLEKVSGKRRRVPHEAPDSHAHAVLAAKPLAFWRLNEIAGSEARDATGKRRHAAFEDGVAFFLDGATRDGRAVHFAGGRMVADAAGLGERYSVALWFWNGMPAGLREVTGYLWAHGDLALGLDREGRLFAASGDHRLTGRAITRHKEWTHLVLARDGGRVTVFVDGSEEFSGMLAGGSGASLYLGGREIRESTFEGKIDEVALFGRTLLSGEVATLYGSRHLTGRSSPTRSR